MATSLHPHVLLQNTSHQILFRCLGLCELVPRHDVDSSPRSRIPVVHEMVKFFLMRRGVEENAKSSQAAALSGQLLRLIQPHFS